MVNHGKYMMLIQTFEYNFVNHKIKWFRYFLKATVHLLVEQIEHNFISIVLNLF